MVLMKNLNSRMKWLATGLSVFSMSIAPLAQGAAAKNAMRVDLSQYDFAVDKEAMQEYLTETGMTAQNRPSFLEFYDKVRPTLPKRLQYDFDMWSRVMRDTQMPEMEMTSYKDSEGKEQVRLIMHEGKDTYTISYNPESEKRFIKINNVYIGKLDVVYYEQAVRKLAKWEPTINEQFMKTRPVDIKKAPLKMSRDQWEHMTPYQRAEYFVRLRDAVDNATDVFASAAKHERADAEAPSKYESFVYWWVGLQEANAAQPKAGEPCMVAGYASVYGENTSCGGTTKGWEDLKSEMSARGGNSCGTETKVMCNPHGYGTVAVTGSLCVPRTPSSGPIKQATRDACAIASPLRIGTSHESEDKKRIIESYLKSKGQKVDLKFDKDGKVVIKTDQDKKDFDLAKAEVDSWNAYLTKADNTCRSMPLKAIQDDRKDQYEACKALQSRYMNLQSTPWPLASAVGAAGGPACDEKMRYSVGQGAGCGCAPGSTPASSVVGGKTVSSCPATPAVVSVVAAGDTRGADPKETKCDDDKEKKDDKGNCVAAAAWYANKKNIGLGVLALAAIVGIAYAVKHKKKKKKTTPTTPADPCPVASTPCTPIVTTPEPTPAPSVAPPPVEPPVVTPDPPIVVPPDPVNTTVDESTDGTTTSTSGGIRKSNSR